MKNSKYHKKPPKLTGNEKKGLVLAVFGAEAEIEDEVGNSVQCHLRKNAEPVITGDNVLWQPDQSHSGVVVSHLPRKSLFYSKNKRLIAANVDAIVIVTAPLPIFSEYMIDRYLVAAENLKIRPVILLNKIDLLDTENKKNIETQLAVYEKLGYSVLFSSALFAESLTDLDKFLHDKTAVLVGASGVGKSSIIRALTSHPEARVGDTSAMGLGKHTTTVTRLYHLIHGGNLIDSPGVREFGLSNIGKENVMQGFVEFLTFLNQCKFRNCTHQKEPGCAIMAALENGEISQQRFESYEKILAEVGKEARY